MSVEISWYVPGKVILRQYSGEVNKDDILAIRDNLPSMLAESQGGLIYSIEDLSEMKHLNVSLASIRLITIPKSSMGWSILVMNNTWAMNRFSKFMGSTAAQLLGVPLRTANSIEDALTFLKDVDPDVTRAFEAAKVSA